MSVAILKKKKEKKSHSRKASCEQKIFFSLLDKKTGCGIGSLNCYCVANKKKRKVIFIFKYLSPKYTYLKLVRAVNVLSSLASSQISHTIYFPPDSFLIHFGFFKDSPTSRYGFILYF